MTMSDDKGPDDKIIAVHVDDPEYSSYRDISELPPHRLKEIQRFFLDYKVLENKAVSIEDMRGTIDALHVIRDSIRLYREKFRGAPGHP
jgi:inorganic pyrophosphatase